MTRFFPTGHPNKFRWKIMGFNKPQQTVETVCYDTETESMAGVISCLNWAMRKGAVEIHISRLKKIGDW